MQNTILRIERSEDPLGSAAISAADEWEAKQEAAPDE